MRCPPLVSVPWLSARLPSVLVVDASWYLPAMNRNGRAEFEQKRIPGAVFFDVDATDDTSKLPHMLPSEAYFSDTMRRLGISKDEHVVCYDGKGIFSSARLWWMLRAYGHDQASVLDGGLPAWERAGERLALGAPSPATAADRPPFQSALRTSLVCGRDRMRAIAAAEVSPAPQVIDARSQARFEGTVAEARPGCRSGHIPGSRCVPFDRTLADDGTMLPPERLSEVFAAAGVDVTAPLVGSCGSGVTASVLALALAQLGREELLEVYDGSWAEWGSDESLPLATGPAAP